MAYEILCPTCGDTVSLTAPGRCPTCTTFLSQQFIEATRHCRICGHEVHRERNGALYCSQRCARRAVYLRQRGQMPQEHNARQRPDIAKRHAIATKARQLGIDAPPGASLARLFHKLAELDAFDTNTPANDRETILSTLAEYVSQMPLLPHDYGVWRASRPWAQRHPFAELLAEQVDFPIWPLTAAQGAQSHDDHQARQPPLTDPDLSGGSESREDHVG